MSMPQIISAGSQRSFLAVAMGVLCVFLALGCDKSEDLKTIQGLQEENKVLREQITTLETRISGVASDKDSAAAQINEIHRTEVAQLEQQITTLQLNLGAVEREKLALTDVVNREPRIVAATDVRGGIERMILLLILMLSLLMLGFVGLRLRASRDRLHLLTVQCVSELRHIGGGR